MTDMLSGFIAGLERVDQENEEHLRQLEELEETRRQRMANRSVSVESAQDRRSARERILQETQARQSPRRTRVAPARSASFNLSDSALNMQQERESFRTAFEEARTNRFGTRPSNPVEPAATTSPVLSRRGSDNALSARLNSSVAMSRQFREQIANSLDLGESLSNVSRSIIQSSSLRPVNLSPYRAPSQERLGRYARQALGITGQEENPVRPVASDASVTPSVAEADRASDTGSDRGSASDLRTTVLRNRRRGTRYQSDLTSLSTFLASSSSRKVEISEEDALPVLGMAEKLPYVDSDGKTHWISRTYVSQSGTMPVPVIKHKSQPVEADTTKQPGPSEAIASEIKDPQKRFESLREMLYKHRYNTTNGETNGDSLDGQEDQEVKQLKECQQKPDAKAMSVDVKLEDIEIDDERFPAHKSFYIKPRPRPSLEIYKASRVRHESDSEYFGTGIADTLSSQTVETVRGHTQTSSAQEDLRMEVDVGSHHGSQLHASGYGPVLSPIQSPRLLQQSSTEEVISEADQILEQLHQMHVNAELPLDTSHLDLEELRMIQQALEESATPLASPTGSQSELNNNMDYTDTRDLSMAEDLEGGEERGLPAPTGGHLVIREAGDVSPALTDSHRPAGTSPRSTGAGASGVGESRTARDSGVSDNYSKDSEKSFSGNIDSGTYDSGHRGSGTSSSVRRDSETSNSHQPDRGTSTESGTSNSARRDSGTSNSARRDSGTSSSGNKENEATNIGGRDSGTLSKSLGNLESSPRTDSDDGTTLTNNQRSSGSFTSNQGNLITVDNNTSTDEIEVFEVTEEVTNLTAEQMEEIQRAMRRYSSGRLSSTSSNQ